MELRPKNFKTFIGNEIMIKSLKQTLKKADRPHSFLFTGPSGCGKTTLARILKRYLKCSDSDFKEVNMSNNRGIDTARDILNSVKYRPLSGNVKIYLLDEVHGSTKDFQNALLKILEEPPEHVYFILCTTEPEKLLITIKRRCSVFPVVALKDDQSMQLLNNACEKINTKIHEDIKNEIIEYTINPGQALVVLGQIQDMEKEDALEAIPVLCNQVDNPEVIELCRMLMKKSGWTKLSKTLKGIKDDPEKVRRAILGYFTSVMLNGKNPADAAYIIECFKEPFFHTGKAGLVSACFEAIDS